MKHIKTAVEKVDSLISGLKIIVKFDISREPLFLDITTQEEAELLSRVSQLSGGIAKLLPDNFLDVTFNPQTVALHWTKGGRLNTAGATRAAKQALKTSLLLLKQKRS